MPTKGLSMKKPKHMTSRDREQMAEKAVNHDMGRGKRIKPKKTHWKMK